MLTTIESTLDAYPFTAVFVLGVIVFLAWVALSRRQAKGAPPHFPYLTKALSGEFAMKLNGPNKLVRAGYEQLGECFTLQVLNENITVMLGPEAQEKVFALRDEEGEQRSVYKFTVPVFGPNIAYDAEPRRMAEQLRFLKFGLAGAPMKRHSSKIVEETEAFFAKWGNEEHVVDLHDTMSQLTINTASRALMGKEIRHSMHAKFGDLYQTLSDGMTHLTVAFPYAPVPLHRARDKARTAIVALFKAVIDKKRADEAAGFALDPNEDMINFLMSKTYSNKAPVPDDDICGLLLTTLFAGQHTSTITSTWCGLEIVANQKELLPKLLEEQQRVLDKTGGKLTYEALQEMELLYSCVKETLRKYPPLIALMRRLLVPLQFKQHTIPAGNIVAVVPSVAHKLHSVFPEPDSFDPTRFTREWDAADQKRKWIPFGGGIHKCLGQKFGLLQVTAIWSVLIRNFDMKLVDKIPPVDYTHIVAGPSPGTRVSFKRKKKPMTFGPASNGTPKAGAKEKAANKKTEDGAVGGMTEAEVAKHNTQDDCYVIIHGNVYDVTKFTLQHPGGVERLIQHAGKDATFAFENQDHSARARTWMKRFFVKKLIS